MPKPTMYQLLKDIHEVTGRLEKKYDRKLEAVDKRQDEMESKLDTMAGKASIGIIILSTVIGTVASLIGEWFQKRF